MKAERKIPYDRDAEQSLLGACLINNEAYHRVSDFLTAQHFYEPAHQKLFDGLAKFVREGKVATPTTIKPFIAGIEVPDGDVDKFLRHLMAHGTTVLNAPEYGRMIYDMAVRRTLMALGEQMVEQACTINFDITPTAQIETVEQKLFHISETGRYGSGFMTFDQAATEAIDMAARAYQREGKLAGLSTGIIDIDGRLGGLQNSDLIVLAGRPGMGKTALGTNIAYNVARGAREMASKPVGFFSLEMSGEQLATRIIGDLAEVPSSTIRRGDIQERDFDRLTDMVRSIKNMPLFIDQAGGLSVAQVAARARRLKRQHDVGLLVVDYLQLMRGSGTRRNDNRVNEVTEITTGLKALAKELNIPILALSQLSRAVESRDDKRPQLSDLRESGSIEQDADVVMLLYRAEYYHEMCKPHESDREKFQEWMANGMRLQGIAEVIIAKQRHGPTGTIELHFDKQMMRFSDLAAPHHEYRG